MYADLLHRYFSELGCVYRLCVRSCVVLCPCWSGVLVSIHLPFLGEQLGSCWGVSFRPYSGMLQLVLYFLNYSASPFSSVVELGLIPSAKCSFWTRKYPCLQNHAVVLPGSEANGKVIPEYCWHWKTLLSCVMHCNLWLWSRTTSITKDPKNMSVILLYLQALKFWEILGGLLS